jgi:hypothetical protein
MTLLVSIELPYLPGLLMLLRPALSDRRALGCQVVVASDSYSQSSVVSMVLDSE